MIQWLFLTNQSALFECSIGMCNCKICLWHQLQRDVIYWVHNQHNFLPLVILHRMHRLLLLCLRNVVFERTEMWIFRNGLSLLNISSRFLMLCFLVPISSKSSSKVERTGAPKFWLYAQCGWDRAAQSHRWMKIHPAMYDVTPASRVWRRWMKHTSQHKARPFILPY